MSHQLKNQILNAMITYDILKENYSNILNFADKFNILDRKGKKKERRFIILKKFEDKESKKSIEGEILKGMMFEKFSINDIRKNLDYIIFFNGNENVLSEVSKYNEVDVIISNEIMDRTIFKNMNKNFISLAFNFSEILNSWGMQRIKKLGIMKKNFQMAKRYEVNYIISTFAGDIFEYKPTETLISYGRILGMSKKESRNAVSKNYENIIRKFNNRNNENLLTDGLEIIKFGSVKKKKKRYGYL